MSLRNSQQASRKADRTVRTDALRRACQSVIPTQSAPFEVLENRVLMSVSAQYFNDGFWGNGDGNRPAAPSVERPFPDQTVAVARTGDVVTTVNQINYDWGTGSPDPAIRGDNHSTVFAGKIVAPEDGEYTITGWGDDDTHVFINGQLVSSNPGGHGIEDPGSDASIGRGGGVAPVTLTAGSKYDLLVLQAEGGGGSGVFLRWITPTIAGSDNVVAVNVPAANLVNEIAVPDAPTAFARTTTDANGDPLPATEIAFTFTDNSTEEIRYELQRSTGGGPFVSIRSIAPINGGRISDLGAANGVAYTYRLAAVNFAGVGLSANTINATGAVLPPAAPTGLTVTPAATTADLAFTDNSNNETGFEVLRGKTNNIADATLVATLAADATTYTATGLLPGTQYFFFVRAINDAAKSAAISGSATTTTPTLLDLSAIPAGPGALARYYNNQERSGDPALVRVDPNIAFDFGNGSPEEGTINPDNHSGLWTGQITVPVTGTYTFITATDDGGYLTVNGVQVANDPTYHGIFDRLADRTINLTAGVPVNFQFEFFEGGGGSGAALRWIRPDGVRETIPASAFTSNRRTALTTPTNVRITNASGSQVTLLWDADNGAANAYFVELLDSTGKVIREQTVGPEGGPITLTGLTPNTAYSARVRGFSDESGLTAAGTGAFNSGGLAAPAAPTVVRVLPRVGATAITLTDQAFNEAGYVIERSVNGGAFAQAGTLPATAAGVSGGQLVFTDATTTAGQSVVYRIRATGTGGAADSPTVLTTAVTVPTPGTGLRERDYDNIDFTNSAEVPEPVVTIQPVIDENFGNNGPNDPIGPDQFSIIYDGQFQAEVTGSYRFGLSSDDGVSFLLLDPTTGVPLISFNNLGARRGADFANPQDTVGPVNLVAGTKYPIEVRMVEDGGGAGVKLFQSIESGPFETVPGATLFPDAPTTLFAPLNLRGSALATDKITLLFDDANFNETGFIVERAASAGGPFTLAGTLPANANSFTLAGPFPADVPVFFRVRATGAGAAVSANSPVISVTPYAGNGTDTALTLNGNAKFITLPAATDTDLEGLQLVDNNNNELGSAYLTKARNVNKDFVSNFSFQIPEGNGADGFAFVIQANNPNALGGGGGGLGSQGVLNSLAIKFDVYNNINQTGVYVNGEMADDGADIGFEIDNGSIYDVTLTYNADATGDSDAVTVKIVDRADPTIVFEQTFDADHLAAPFDIDTVLGGQNGYIGFSGANGGLNIEANILDWSIDGQDIPFHNIVDPITKVAVTQVFVNGTGLSSGTTTGAAGFRTKAGIDSVFGYPVPAGTAQLKSIPWTSGVNQIALRFDQNVAASLQQGDLVIRGVNTATYTVSNFSYDAATKTGVWTLSAPIFNDKVRLFLDDAQLGGLDGEWVDNGDAYPSGNGTAGGDFSFRLNVLRGDATQDGTVNAQDLAYVKQRLNKTAANPGTTGATYTAFGDLTMDGSINAQDLSAAKQRLNNKLPTADPATALLFSSKAISR